MSHSKWKTAGVFAFMDIGIPTTISEGQYCMLIMVHGMAFQAGVFSRLTQKAGKLGACVVLINQHGYPLSKPFSDEEHTILILSADDTVGGQLKVNNFVKGLACELYNFLLHLISAGDIPLKSITLTGWLLGVLWMAALLAHAPSFPVTEVVLHQYLCQVIVYDPVPQLLCYHPPGLYDLLKDPSVAPGEHGKVFLTWVSGYYAHGDTLETLAQCDTLLEPHLSIENMLPEDLTQNVYEEGAQPDHMDLLLVHSGYRQGTFERLHKAVLFPSQDTASNREWGEIELRYVWCDCAVWLLIWSAWEFKAKIAKKAGDSEKQMRKCLMACICGANHLAHWDEPEHTLSVLLADKPVKETL
ncbi:alpha/beta-hydrolase [Lactarius tabidus]